VAVAASAAAVRGLLQADPLKRCSIAPSWGIVCRQGVVVVVVGGLVVGWSKGWSTRTSSTCHITLVSEWSRVGGLLGQDG
jgi:hypothetical protein